MVNVNGQSFVPFLSEERIQRKVSLMGQLLSHDYAGRAPLMLVLMRGAFMFAADLCRACTFELDMAFVGIHSYEGMESTGRVVLEYGLDTTQVQGRDIIIVEDIVDTGRTMSHFLRLLEDCRPNSVAIATLLCKPAALEHDLVLDYVGFHIPNEFVVGYGLDYAGWGRNLPAIYQAAD